MRFNGLAFYMLEFSAYHIISFCTCFWPFRATYKYQFQWLCVNILL